MPSASFMSIRRVGWLICGLLALAALALGYRAMTAPTEATVIVEWTTASELDTAGFSVTFDRRRINRIIELRTCSTPNM